ncbi:MAG: 1-acyl-sn-glycerol-3-phosphate acyltransferase [Planctomycetaceae bacterium]|nr:1-acyl-sn-glycerol-3-phosphate acyltransferase [Planctomycetaceae bacterium]
MRPPLMSEFLGWCVLLGLGVALGWAIRRKLQEMPLTVPQSLLFGFSFVLTRILWRASVRGRFEIPPGQGAIIVSNHRAPVDPCFFYLCTRRVVHWMVAKEYVVHPALAWFFRTTECIPVSRGGIDTKATKIAIRYAQQGGLVGMFPEGRLNKTRDVLLPGRPGAALIALKAQVPVVPMYVEGSPYDTSVFSPLVMPAHVRLTVGKPIDLSAYYDRGADRGTQQEVTLLLLKEIAALAGQRQFQPRLAGRDYREPESNWRKEGD